MAHMLHSTDLVAMLPPGLAAHYNAANLQRERVLHCLRRAGTAGVLGPDLARMCNVPSITKRISELRRAGAQIDTEGGGYVVADDGKVSACARYVMRCANKDQGDLFGTDAAGSVDHA